MFRRRGHRGESGRQRRESSSAEIPEGNGPHPPPAHPQTRTVPSRGTVRDDVPGVAATAGHANRKSTGGREHPAAVLDCLLGQEFQIAQDLRTRIGETLKWLCLSQKAVVVSPPRRPVHLALPPFTPIDGRLCELNPIAPAQTAESAI